MTSSPPAGSDPTGPDIEILVVDDDVDVGSMIETMIGAAYADDDQTYVVTRAGSMAEALEMAEDRIFDLVLLDLVLPDSTDLTTVLRMLDSVPRSPVVVVTGSHDETLALDALRAGAHDYILKSNLDVETLWRTIRHTLTRHRAYLSRIEVLEERRRLDAELTHLATDDGTSVTAGALGVQPLRERSFSTFDTLGERYRDLLEVNLRGRQFTTEVGGAEAGLRDLARDLGFLRAGPRDVIEMHVAATEAAINNQPRGRRLVLLETARLQVLELRGHLTAHYRAQSLGSSMARTIASTEQEER
ncbi:MAG: response regulator [Acidimicrobiales bacterium]|nr:response regulator [Acidimicrobiales bacterium]